MSRLNRFIQKGRQVVDLSKMSNRVDKEEVNLEKLYANLGRVFYKVHGESPGIIYDDLFRTIAGSELNLHQLKVEIEHLLLNHDKKS